MRVCNFGGSGRTLTKLYEGMTGWQRKP